MNMSIGQRFIFIGVLSLVALGIGRVVGLYMQRPNLYAGDRLEVRVCRECGGSGKDNGTSGGEGMPAPGGKCPACAGSGKVEVTLPGPKHPALVKGSVYDLAAYPADNPVAQFMTERNPMQPIPGAVT